MSGTRRLCRGCRQATSPPLVHRVTGTLAATSTAAQRVYTTGTIRLRPRRGDPGHARQPAAQRARLVNFGWDAQPGFASTQDAHGDALPLRASAQHVGTASCAGARGRPGRRCRPATCSPRRRDSSPRCPSRSTAMASTRHRLWSARRTERSPLAAWRGAPPAPGGIVGVFV